VFLWCAAILFHQLFQGRFVVLDATAPLTAAALWAILRPSSPARLLLLLAVHLATVAAELPRVVNHWLLMGFTSLGLLVALAPRLRARAAGRPARSLAELLPPVQAQILLVYAFATLAKLNAGFFDPAHSCGAEHYRRLAQSLPLLPQAPWASDAAIGGTLLAEAALPLALLLRRTRLPALAAGWAFHLALGWNGYWDFSAVAAAYYAAFAPARLLEGGRRALERRARLRSACEALLRAARRRLAFPAALLLLLAPLGLAALAGAPEHELALAANRAGRLLWLGAWAALGLALLLSWRAAPARGEPAPAPRVRSAWRQPVLWLGPALAFANGLCPYLGLKTEHSYTMFSNLRTEGEEWNHYLVPRSLRVFGFQDEPVRILRSSQPRLERLARGGFRLVPFELRRAAREYPQATLVYETREGRRRAAPLSADPLLAQAPHPLLAKLLLFRPVPAARRNVCLH
jgi:hypothetical protein